MTHARVLSCHQGVKTDETSAPRNQHVHGVAVGARSRNCEDRAHRTEARFRANLRSWEWPGPAHAEQAPQPAHSKKEPHIARRAPPFEELLDHLCCLLFALFISSSKDMKLRSHANHRRKKRSREGGSILHGDYVEKLSKSWIVFVT